MACISRYTLPMKTYTLRMTSSRSVDFTAEVEAPGAYTATMIIFEDFPHVLTAQIIKVDGVATDSPLVKAKFH